MSRLNKRVDALEAKSRAKIAGSMRWLLTDWYDHRKDSRTYDEFVADEEKRLGRSEGDNLIIPNIVHPGDV